MSGEVMDKSLVSCFFTHSVELEMQDQKVKEQHPAWKSNSRIFLSCIFHSGLDFGPMFCSICFCRM